MRTAQISSGVLLMGSSSRSSTPAGDPSPPRPTSLTTPGGVLSDGIALAVVRPVREITLTGAPGWIPRASASLGLSARPAAGSILARPGTCELSGVALWAYSSNSTSSEKGYSALGVSERGVRPNPSDAGEPPRLPALRFPKKGFFSRA